MREMNIAERASEPELLLNPIPSWFPWLIFLVGASLQIVRAFLALDAYGVTDIVANFVVFPFIYLPIVTQFFAIYVAIEFFAPWRLWQSDVGIHFFDPEGVGGLRPLGELVKKAYYFVAVGLVAYALLTYAPFVSTEWEVSEFANVLFTGVWIITIGTVGFAVYILHRFLQRDKREEIQRLEAEIQERVSNPWDIAAYDVPTQKKERVQDLRERMERVSATKEYPATFSIWSQLLLSIVIPKAIQLLLANG
jgi:ABC-type multidrug transport system fused ATPase/permease subunit